MRVTGRPWDVALADVAIPGGNWETAKEWEEKLEDLQVCMYVCRYIYVESERARERERERPL